MGYAIGLNSDYELKYNYHYISGYLDKLAMKYVCGSELGGSSLNVSMVGSELVIVGTNKVGNIVFC